MLDTREAYSYECSGFARIKNAITPQQVDQAKRLIQENWPGGIPWKFPVLHLGRVFWEMMTNTHLLPLAEEFAGEHFRMDHAFGLSSNGAIPQLHGGPHSNQYACLYIPLSGQARRGIGRMNFGFCLEGQSKETGGFCYIPGSHKTQDTRDGLTVWNQVYKNSFDHESIVVPTLEPGDMILFTEAMIHGDTGWRNPTPGSYRMQVYFMFTPGWASWRDPREGTHLLQYARTDLERRMIEPCWSGRFSETPISMGVSNERRKRTISGS